MISAGAAVSIQGKRFTPRGNLSGRRRTLLGSGGLFGGLLGLILGFLRGGTFVARRRHVFGRQPTGQFRLDVVVLRIAREVLPLQRVLLFVVQLFAAVGVAN